MKTTREQDKGTVPEHMQVLPLIGAADLGVDSDADTVGDSQESLDEVVLNFEK